MHRLRRRAAELSAPADSGDASRLTRDRLTWLVYSQLAIYGYFLYGFSPALPLLREDEHTGDAVSGLHGTALAAGAIVTGLLSPRVLRRWGRARTMWAGLVGLCLGIVVFCLTSLLPVTLLGALVSGIFGSAVVNTSSAVLADHHREHGPAAISEANALAAGVGLVSPLVLGLLVTLGIGWRAGLLTTLLLVAVVALTMRRVPVAEGDLPDDERRQAPDSRSGRADGALDTRSGGGRRDRVPSRRLPAHYWWAWGVLVLCISVEFCLTIWSSDVLRHRVGLSSGAAATGVTAVVTGMALGRVVGGRIALHRPVDWLLYRALTLTGAGFGVFWMSRLAWLSFAGLFAAGLGIALLFPLSIARAIRFSDGRTDLATARASLGAGLAVGAGPFLLGALADGFGTHRAFLLVPAMLLAAALGIRLGRRGGLSADAASAG